LADLKFSKLRAVFQFTFFPEKSFLTFARSGREVTSASIRTSTVAATEERELRALHIATLLLFAAFAEVSGITFAYTQCFVAAPIGALGDTLGPVTLFATPAHFAFACP